MFGSNLNPDVFKLHADVTINSSNSTESGGISKTAKVPIKDSLFLQDIAQSHHFTVCLKGFSMSKFRVPGGTFSDFLPVKSINLNYTSYENMSIPVSIFGDFPLLNKKRVSTISLTCYDMDDNRLEHELREWENQCFPKGRFVAYMDKIAKEFIYSGYNVKGKETLKVSFRVIPSGNVSVSRDYSVNDAKLVNFSLVCVGDGSTCATGNGKVIDLDDSKDDSFKRTNYGELFPYSSSVTTGNFYEFIPGDYSGNR